MAENGGLSIGAIAPDVNNFQGLSFDVNLNTDGSIRTAEPTSSASSDAPTSISIPQTIFADLGIDPATLTDVRAGFSVFTDDSLFQPRSAEEPSGAAQSESRSAIGSAVISAQIMGNGVPITVDNLNTPIAVELGVKLV